MSRPLSFRGAGVSDRPRNRPYFQCPGYRQVLRGIYPERNAEILPDFAGTGRSALSKVTPWSFPRSLSSAQAGERESNGLDPRFRGGDRARRLSATWVDEVVATVSVFLTVGFCLIVITTTHGQLKTQLTVATLLFSPFAKLRAGSAAFHPGKKPQRHKVNAAYKKLNLDLDGGSLCPLKFLVSWVS